MPTHLAPINSRLIKPVISNVFFEKVEKQLLDLSLLDIMKMFNNKKM